MAQKIRLEIVTPERSVVSTEVDEVVAPGAQGEFGVLPGHTTLLAELGTGRIVYTSGGQSKSVDISGGFAEVRENHMTVLTDKETAI